MSNTVFPFSPRPPYTGGRAKRIESTVPESGTIRLIGLEPTGRYRATAGLLFPDTAANLVQSDWVQFWLQTLQEGTESCLFRDARPAWSGDKGDGNSTGGAGQEFFIDAKYVDAASLVVRVENVIDTNWTLQDNFTKPKIVTTAGFGTGIVTWDYSYYYKCYVGWRPEDMSLLVPGRDRNSQGTDVTRVSFREIAPGDFLAPA